MENKEAAKVGNFELTRNLHTHPPPLKVLIHMALVRDFQLFCYSNFSFYKMKKSLLAFKLSYKMLTETVTEPVD